MRRFLRSTGSLFETAARLMRRGGRGVVLATALLVFADEIQAQPASGSTTVDNLVLAWNYDLPNGIGRLTLRAAASTTTHYAFWLDDSSFQTFGLQLDDAYVLSAGATLRPFTPSLAGVDSDGRNIWQYAQDTNVTIQVDNRGYLDPIFTLDRRFPSHDVELAESSFQTEGWSYPTGSFEAELDFVTIQSIPEPASGAAMVAAGIAAAGRRRRD